MPYGVSRAPGAALLVLLAVGGCGGDDGMVFVPPPPAGFGGVVVRWSITDPAGEPLSCLDLGIVRATVAIGGMPEEVPCGQEQAKAFSGITPGRLPVVITLLNSVDVRVAEHITNVTIEAEKTVEYEHTFVIDDVEVDTGDIALLWRIDQRLPAQACSIVGAESMRMSSRDGSIAEIDITLPCTDGMHVIQDTRSGAYDFFFRLLDADGELVGDIMTVSNVGVNVAETTDISVNFVTEPFVPATLEASWTLTGSVASAMSCFDARGEEVSVSLLNRPIVGGMFMLVASATAACEAGSLLLEAPTGDDYRVTARLFDTFGTPLATEIIDEVELSTRSATVTIDFTF